MKRQDNILFGYSCTPSYGFYAEDDGGFSVEIDINGVVTYKTYFFDFIEQTRSTIKLSPNTIKRIRNILENHAETIENLNNQLNNGSYDGLCNRFIFSGKEIISWNIQFIHIWLAIIVNPDYYKKYVNEIKQENTVLYIFKLITKVLKHEGIKLTLDKAVFYSGKNKFKHKHQIY